MYQSKAPTILHPITIVTDETLNGFNKQTKNKLLNGVIIEILIFLVTHNDTCILSVKDNTKKTTTTKTKGYTGSSTIRPQ